MVIIKLSLKFLPICQHVEGSGSAGGGIETDGNGQELAEQDAENDESYLPSAELQAAASSAHALLSRFGNFLAKLDSELEV